MNNDTILVEKHHDATVKQIVNEMAGVITPKFIYVDDVYEWAKQRGHMTVMPEDVAFSIKSENIIILSRTISQTKKDLILEGIEQRISFAEVAGLQPSFSPAKKILNTDKKFIEHTVRHELAHLQKNVPRNRKEGEAEADAFAFREMKINVIRLPVDQL